MSSSPKRALGRQPAFLNISRWMLVGAAFLSLGNAGCLRLWARGQAGGAANTAGREGHSGPMLGTDIAFTPKFIPMLSPDKPFPLAIHFSGETILAPERKSIAWGSGLAYTTPPRPIAPYFILGTTAHGDVVNGRYSFGNFSPYGELGMLTPLLRPNPDKDESGWILSMGIGAYSFVNYFVGGNGTLDSFVSLRFGIGWEQN